VINPAESGGQQFPAALAELLANSLFRIMRARNDRALTVDDGSNPGFGEIQLVDDGLHQPGIDAHQQVPVFSHLVLDRDLYREIVLFTDRREEQVGYQGLIGRSEEHTSELQSRENLVCRLLLEKKN